MRASILAVMLVVAASCASSRESERSTAPGPAIATATRTTETQAGQGGSAMGMCPMAVPGTSVSAQDTPAGESLTFTTSTGDVNDLRQRVRALAEMHQRHDAARAIRQGTGTAEGTYGAGAGTGVGSDMPSGPMHQHDAMMLPATHASVEDVPGGARLDLVPQDPSAADQLRATARMHAQRLQQDGCAAMMHEHPEAGR